MRVRGFNKRRNRRENSVLNYNPYGNFGPVESYEIEDFGRRKKGKHFHEIEGITSPTKEHEHEYFGETIKTVTSGDTHIHLFKIDANIENGHAHKIYGKTSTEIETEDGHIHTYDGISSLDRGHVHFFQEYTSPEIYNNKR